VPDRADSARLLDRASSTKAGTARIKAGFVAEAEFDRVVDPAKMVRPYVAQVS
jgi:fumarate hydratase class II